jgi:hypothetical protein
MASTATASTAPAAESQTVAGEERRSNYMARTFGWVSLAIGAEATVVAVATSIMMMHEKSVRDSACDAQKVCTPDGGEANDTIGRLAGWNVGAWAVAAAGLGIGAYLLLTNPSEGSRATAVTVAPNGSGLSLGVRSTF